MNKTVGVVIPIYNVEKYLKECLDSVINQTYKNLQVVLVNDGSTDENSLNIAKEYTLKDERFILFDKENGGQSTARNVGIEYFSGEYKLKNITTQIKENSLIEFELDGNNLYNIYKVYKSSKAFNNEKDLGNFTYPNIDYIIFLDSDDYWELNCIEECVPRMEGVDIVWFDSIGKIEIDKYNDWYSPLKNYFYKKAEIITPYTWLNDSIKLNIKGFYFVWLGMIDFNYLKLIKLKFINRIMHQDHHFGMLLFVQAKYIYIYPKSLHVYRLRDNSTINMHNMKKQDVPPYIYDIFLSFGENMYLTREYFSVFSMYIIFLECIKFLNHQNNEELNNLFKNAFFELLIVKIFRIFNFNKDPKNIKKNMKYIYRYKHYINNLPIGATYRIKSQLSYKIGQSIMINGKNIFTILLLPIILICIIVSHKQEIKYKKKYSKKKQLPLDMYKDYNDALLIKRQMTYRMGEIFIKSFKTWYKGGLFKLPFRIYNLHGEFKKNKVEVIRLNNKNYSKCLALYFDAGIGDYLALQPLLKHIRDFYFDYKITFIGNNRFKDIVLTFDKDNIDEYVYNFKNDTCFSNFFKYCYYDILISPYYFRSVWLDNKIKQINAMEKIGNYGGLLVMTQRQRANISAYDKIIYTSENDEFEINRNINFFQKLFGKKIEINNINLQLDVKHFDNIEFNFDNKYAILFPGATDKNRMWDISNFRGVAKHLYDKYKIISYIAGGNSDRYLASDIKQKYDFIHSICGKYSLEDLFYILNKSQIVICNDSGGYHMAQKVSNNIIVISSGGSFNRFITYSEIFTKDKLISTPIPNSAKNNPFKEYFFDKNLLNEISYSDICEIIDLKHSKGFLK